MCNLVAEQDGRIVGILTGTVTPGDDGQVHLYRLYVHPDHCGRGIGRQLWGVYRQHLAPEVRQVDLEVEPQNAGAIRSLRA